VHEAEIDEGSEHGVEVLRFQRRRELVPKLGDRSCTVQTSEELRLRGLQPEVPVRVAVVDDAAATFICLTELDRGPESRCYRHGTSSKSVRWHVHGGLLRVHGADDAED
jgi:hypothetical protein